MADLFYLDSKEELKMSNLSTTTEKWPPYILVRFYWRISLRDSG